MSDLKLELWRQITLRVGVQTNPLTTLTLPFSIHTCSHFQFRAAFDEVATLRRAWVRRDVNSAAEEHLSFTVMTFFAKNDGLDFSF